MPKYFDGLALMLGGGIFNTRFTSVGSKGEVVIFKVRNGSHVRDLPSIVVPRYPFRIIAPVNKLKILEGSLPDECIREMTDSEFKSIEKQIGKRKTLLR